MSSLFHRAAWLSIALVLASASVSQGQDARVTGQVAAYGPVNPSSASQTVVWLTPASSSGATKPVAPMHAVLRQKNKTFEPHLLVVTEGSAVEFPNSDPWFHNVFSLFNGKRFDLGLYEAGTSRTVHFDRAGISYIFCNIHPEMSAVIVVLSTPYFSITDKNGNFEVADVPPGRYTLHFWNEHAQQSILDSMSREVQIAGMHDSLGVLRLRLDVASSAHKNKYGQDYEPPSPNNPVYVQR